MARCHTCGNDYPRTFEVLAADGQRFIFDSFECAIHRLAPACGHCGCRILGHGIEAGASALYCCAHCARESGVQRAVDNTANA
jgi:hypothetical protein